MTGEGYAWIVTEQVRGGGVGDDDVDGGGDDDDVDGGEDDEVNDRLDQDQYCCNIISTEIGDDGNDGGGGNEVEW